MNKKQRRERVKRINAHSKARKERNYKRYREFLILVIQNEGNCERASNKYDKVHEGESSIDCGNCPMYHKLCYALGERGSEPNTRNINRPQSTPHGTWTFTTNKSVIVTDVEKNQRVKEWLEYKGVTKEMVVEVLL